MTSTKKFAVGVDLGGTKIKVGVVDSTGTLLHDTIVPTEADQGPEHVIQQIAKGIHRLLDSSGNMHGDFIGIGIGAPGTVDLNGGTVKYPPNFPNWGVVMLGDEINKIFNLRVEVDNDANAAAVGEAKFGAAVGDPDFIMITLGTGVGGGIIMNGKIFRGTTGGAGELGHISIDYDGPRCNCGNYGCIEAYVGQKYLSKRTIEKLKDHPDSKIFELSKGDMNEVEPYLISQAANQGDQFALGVFKEMGTLIGVALATILNILDFRLVVVGGGVANAGKPLFDAMNESARSRVLAPMKDDVRVIPAKLGNHAGILGAAALLF
jgi:glucokinase